MPDAKSDKVKIFISYARADKEQADRLMAALNKNGYACWIDTSDIRGGHDWVKAIEAGILNSYALVPIITSRSLSSKWVRREILWAEKKGKQIVHWVCENVLEDSILLADCQAVTLFDTDFDDALSKLLKALSEPASDLSVKINCSNEQHDPVVTDKEWLELGEKVAAEFRNEQRDPVVAYIEQLELKERAATKRNKTIFIVAWILLATLIGFWAWQYFKQPTEVLRYSIVEDGKSGYRIRFRAPSMGYLYIVSAPHKGADYVSKYSVYLSNNPDEYLNVQSNLLYPDQSFLFPGKEVDGITEQLATKEHVVEHHYWLIWSATKLEERKFYSKPMGKLEEEEDRYLEALCAKTEKVRRPMILKDSEGNFVIMAYSSLPIPFESPQPFAKEIVVSWPR